MASDLSRPRPPASTPELEAVLPPAWASLHGALVVPIARALGASAGAERVFGTPVERDGVTVIPVAGATWGFGGGSGAGRARRLRAAHTRPAESAAAVSTGEPGADPDADADGSGGGAGGGMRLAPLGYIEISGGRARFRRIWTAGSVMRLIGVLGALVLLALRATRRERD